MSTVDREVIDITGIHTNLLTYYSTLTQHHKSKLGFIATIYLTLTQLFIFTPKETINENLLSTNKYIFGMSWSILLTLLILGILHHIVSLAIVATRRLNILKDELYRLLPDNERNNDSYENFSKQKDIDTIDGFSASKWSSFISLALIVGLFILTFVHSFYIAKTVFENDLYGTMFIGMVFVVQLGLIIFYGSHIITRRTKFYEIRDVLKIVQRSKSKIDCKNKIKDKYNS